MSAPPFAMGQTCSECPWLVSSPPGKFPPSRYYALAESCTPGGLPAVFGCHMTPDGSVRACAGMLKVCGADNNRVRIAQMTGNVDLLRVEATGPLYKSYLAMAVANGCDPTHEAFAGLPRD